MSTSDIAELEAALMTRAQRLAEEYLENGRRTRDRTLTEAATHLRVREEREILAAKAQAERAYRQRVQAAEIAQQATLDRLRWDLVLGVMRALDTELAHLVADRARYESLLQRWLARAARAIERDELVVLVNASDRAALAPQWTRFAQAASPKRATLAQAPLPIQGGLEVRSQDNDIRVDQSFEGRRERLAAELEAAILERLFTSTQGSLNGG